MDDDIYDHAVTGTDGREVARTSSGEQLPASGRSEMAAIIENVLNDMKDENEPRNSCMAEIVGQVAMTFLDINLTS